ncbi:MAG: hypothetical protein AAF637_15005 [Pseudomonadota bacterium]
MFWSLGTLLLVVAALTYGYWDHRGKSRRITRVLAPLAGKYAGQLKAANFLALPQLRFELAGRRFLVTVMANSGAQIGSSGPFTVVEAELPFDTGEKLRIERSDGRLSRGVRRLVDKARSGGVGPTGDDAFDRVFRLAAGERVFANKLLDADLRSRLLGTALPQLDLRVDGSKVTVLMNGSAQSATQVEALIDLAMSVGDRCERDRTGAG